MLFRSFLYQKLIFVFCLCTVFVSNAQVYQSKPTIALIGALDEEIELLRQSIQKPKDEVIHGIHFFTGKIGKQRVVVVKTGIGKVNASMTTAFLLQHFRPQKVIFTGIAGGLHPDLKPGDMVIGKKTIQYDFGYINNDTTLVRNTRNPINSQLNPLYFEADSELLSKAQIAAKKTLLEKISMEATIPSVIVGTIVTGDLFVNSEKKGQMLRLLFNADATEMEGGAVAQICWQQQVPCLVIRSMSDKANSNAQENFAHFKKVAAHNSASLLLNILSEISH